MKQTSADSSQLTEDGRPQAASSKRSRTYRKLVGTPFDSSDVPNIDGLMTQTLGSKPAKRAHRVDDWRNREITLEISAILWDAAFLLKTVCSPVGLNAPIRGRFQRAQ